MVTYSRILLFAPISARVGPPCTRVLRLGADDRAVTDLVVRPDDRPGRVGPYFGEIADDTARLDDGVRADLDSRAKLGGGSITAVE